jgi:PAS domain S-box-containing protein
LESGAIANEQASPALHSVVELESLAACWLDMAAATTLSEIEAAALAGLRGLIDVEIAYLARRERGIWTIGTEIGLEGDIAGVNIADEFVPYAEALRAGETICYERPKDMGFALSRMLTGLGLRSVFAVPIMRGDSCIGALAIGRPVPSRFSVRDRALVRLFTAHLSVLLAKRDLVASLETLAEAVPGLVLRTDPSGWIYWYNQRWYDYTGQTPEEAVGWGWQTAHHPVDFQRVIEEWPRALATGVAIKIEFRLRRFDGVFQWHLAHVDPVRDDNGHIIGWCGSLINIDAQRQTLEHTKRVADSLQDAFLPQHLPSRDYLRIDASYVAAETDALSAATGTTPSIYPVAKSVSRSATLPDTCSLHPCKSANFVRPSTRSRSVRKTRPKYLARSIAFSFRKSRGFS